MICNISYSGGKGGITEVISITSSRVIRSQRMVPMQTAAAGGTKLRNSPRVCVAFATHTYMTCKRGHTDRCIHTSHMNIMQMNDTSNLFLSIPELV